MRKRSFFYTLAALLALGLGLGCKSDNPAKTPTGIVNPTKQATVGFAYKAVMVNSVKTKARSKTDTTFTGKLEAKNLDTGAIQSFDWYVQIDEETFVATSNKTLVLNSGTYDFKLDLSKGDHHYYGEVSGQVVVDSAQLDIPITLRPVIGNTAVNTTLFQYAALKWKYPADEFKAIDTPMLGVRINGSDWMWLFNINKETGMTDNYMGVLPGEYQIELALYDGNRQIGRSIKAQEKQHVVPGENIRMDIVPLSGQAAFTLPMEGGTATIDFTIPKEVIKEAGGLESLKAVFIADSPVNGYSEQVLTIIPPLSDGGDYKATASLANYKYDTFYGFIYFQDLDDGVYFGDGWAYITLNKEPNTARMEIWLAHRAIASGNLMATVGVNALTPEGEPLAGVSIYVNGELVGITGSGALGTPGFCPIFLKKGEYELKGALGAMSGQKTVKVNPLEVINVDITMKESIPVVVRVPLAQCPPIPDGMKMASMTGPNSPTPDGTSDTCPIIQWQGRSYWPFSYIDNRYSMGIACYDQAGNLVGQVEKTGARYVWNITVDETSKKVTFYGQSNLTVTMTWADLQGM